MKKLFSTLLLLGLVAAFTFGLVMITPEWEGVDHTVVAKYAEQAGRPPRKPYIDTDRGDLLLFFFLIAGVAGGFVGGYFFREIFPPEKSRHKETQS